MLTSVSLSGSVGPLSWYNCFLDGLGQTTPSAESRCRTLPVGNKGTRKRAQKQLILFHDTIQLQDDVDAVNILCINPSKSFLHAASVSAGWLNRRYQ